MVLPSFFSFGTFCSSQSDSTSLILPTSFKVLFLLSFLFSSSIFLVSFLPAIPSSPAAAAAAPPPPLPPPPLATFSLPPSFTTDGDVVLVG